MVEEDEAFISLAGPDEEEPPPPWFRPDGFDPDNIMLLLHNEILDFCDFMAPRRSEVEDVAKVERFIKEIVDREFGYEYFEPKVVMFGSCVTGLSLPNSDVDLAINNVPSNAIYMVEKAVRKRPREVDQVVAIHKAKVPLVKFVHRETNRAVDVSFNMEAGSDTGRLTLDFLREFPQARPLVMVVKKLLSQRTLQDTFTGGIGSYLCMIMVVSLLQHRVRHNAATGKEPEWNLGTLLMAFLKTYGDTFNSVSTGISVRQGGFYFNKPANGMLQDNRPHLLCVENPAVPSIDCGQNSYMYYPNVRQAFWHSYVRLEQAMLRVKREARDQQQQQGSSRSPTAPFSLLGLIIHADDGLSMRAQLFRNGTLSGRPVTPAMQAAVSGAGASSEAPPSVASSESNGGRKRNWRDTNEADRGRDRDGANRRERGREERKSESAPRREGRGLDRGYNSDDYGRRPTSYERERERDRDRDSYREKYEGGEKRRRLVVTNRDGNGRQVRQYDNASAREVRRR